VPQTLRNVKDTLFSFRVKQPAKQKTLIFQSGRKRINEKTFFRVTPAEMIRFELKASELEGVKDLRIKLV
jgi:hypothetical protein